MYSRITLSIFVLILIVRNIDAEYVQTQILEARQLFPYKSYKDVQLFHFTVPSQVSLATFQFKANGSSHCSPKEVAVYLQYGSYPVMNPHNSTFPDDFILKRLYPFNVSMLTDSVHVVLNVTNPMPGNWYAAGFLVDATERIAQKGLFTPCLAWLTTSVKLNISHDVVTLLTDSKVTQELGSPKMYRFFANNNSWSCDVKLRNCENDIDEKCSAVVRVRSRAFPSVLAKDNTKVFNCSSNEECTVSFVPAPNDWNYFLIESLAKEKLKFELSLYNEACDNIYYYNPINDTLDFELINITSTEANLTEIGYIGVKMNSTNFGMTCAPNIQLIRISLSTNLAFEYNLPSEYEDAYPLILNISNYGPTYTSFEILPNVDIGGTLVLELGISPFMNMSQSNVSVLGCVVYGTRPESLKQSICEGGITLSVNTSSSSDRLTTALIPYPESGIWYFGLLPVCYYELENETVIDTCEASTTSIFLRIRSSPCILGHCGRYGTCYQYVSGGFIFSTCNCIAGWRGWGCTDGSAAHTSRELLMDVLLLTLSNLLFIPAILLGAYRKYYTEALVYFTTMAFSAFYHACDADVFSYCIVRLGVLQFCDFFSAILSIWVTLIAMADLPHALQSLTHMAGSIIIALGVEYDRTGLWVIVIPAGLGFLILVTSWVTKCYRNSTCYPKKRVWLLCLLPGVVLASLGLVTYAFYETKDNYPFVHSAWHATIALSVLFLLPKKKTTKDEGIQEPLSTSSYVRVTDTTANSSVASAPPNSAYEHLLASTP